MSAVTDARGRAAGVGPGLVTTLLLAAVALLPAVALAQRTLGRSSGAHAAGQLALTAALVRSDAGQELDGAWRFFARGDLRYAAPALPVGAGVGVAWPTSMDRLPPSFDGHGWFRARVAVPAPLRGRPLAFAVRYRGAIEIFVDGERVARFGELERPGDAPPTVACFHPRVVRVTFPGASHVIAVRLVNRWARRLSRLGYGPGFALSVGVRQRLRAHWDARWAGISRLHMLFYGVTLGLAALHFLLFLFYRERPANLYFAITAASIAMLARGIEMTGSSPTAQGIVSGNALFNASVVLACVFGQRFYYQVFRERAPRYSIAFAVVGLGLVGGAYWVPYAVVYAFALLAFGEQLVTLARAMVARARGAALIGAGGVIAILMTAYTIFVELGYVPGSPFVFLYGFLGLCASMSVHLAREIATDKRALAEQLVEIRRLSDEALAREREAAEERLARDAAAANNKQRELQLAEARKRKAAVDALDRANDELSRMQAQLVQTEKMASLGELVDGVAREMDEPVARIVARAETMRAAQNELGLALEQSGEASADRRLARALAALGDAARVIEDGGQRVAVIAERLAQFARVDASQRESLARSELVDEAVELLAARFER